MNGKVYDINRNGYVLCSRNQFTRRYKLMRVNITLACTECGDRNYITKKNKRNNPERIELKKYCPRLKRVTLHRETK